MTKTIAQRDKTPTEKYAGFIDAYGNFGKASRNAEMLRSPEIRLRNAAREYALKYTENIPGLEGIAKDPIAQAEFLKSDTSVDKILGYAVDYNETISSKRFELDNKHIIDETPETGLAAIVLDAITPVEMKGNERYDKASEAHDAYFRLNQRLKEIKQEGRNGKIDHEELYKTLMYDIAKKIEGKLSEDKYSNDNGLKVEAMKVAGFVLASSQALCLDGVETMRDSYRKDFEKYLPKDGDKAGYARSILTEMSEDEDLRRNAMGAVYYAHQIAEKLKKSEK